MRDSDHDDAQGPARAGRTSHAIEALARVALDRLARREEAAELSEAFLESFCGLLMAGDYRAAEKIMRAMTPGHGGYSRVADGILTSAARHLGAKWEADKASFAEVSIGIAQIFRLNQAVGQRHRPWTRNNTQRLGLFATLPAQAHNLGLVLAAEAFRQEDWEVKLLLDAPAHEILERVRRMRPEAVGLSVSAFDRKHRMANLIGDLGRLPLRFRILVGGSGAPDLVARLPARARVMLVTDIASALRGL